MMNTATLPIRSVLTLAILALTSCNVVSVDDEQRTVAPAKGDGAAGTGKPERPLGPARSEYRSAYASLQKAVADGDKEAASRLLSYPLEVSRGETRRTIATPAQFVTEYDTIITPSIRQVIVEHEFDTVVDDRYDRSDDVDLFVAGTLLGAVAEGVAHSWSRRYSTSDNRYYLGYARYYDDGCHGLGCLVDPPPPAESFDGYTGCHGAGCLVDDPDAVPGDFARAGPVITDGVPEPGQTVFSDGDDYGRDSPPEPGQTAFVGGADEDRAGPPEPRGDDGSDGADDIPEPDDSDDYGAPDDDSDDIPEPDGSDDYDAPDDDSEDPPEPDESDGSDDD